MPDFSGTGPRGSGPGTGRGLGFCGRIRAGMGGTRRFVWSAAGMAVLGVIARDARNPDGLTMRIAGRIRNLISDRKRDKQVTVAENPKQLQTTGKDTS